MPLKKCDCTREQTVRRDIPVYSNLCKIEKREASHLTYSQHKHEKFRSFFSSGEQTMFLTSENKMAAMQIYKNGYFLGLAIDLATFVSCAAVIFKGHGTKLQAF